MFDLIRIGKLILVFFLCNGIWFLFSYFSGKMIISDLIVSGKFILGVLLCNGIGLLSSYFSGISQNGYFGINTPVIDLDYVNPNPWYGSLIKPSVWLPNFFFGPVWFSLYTTMGIGLILIIQSFGFLSVPFWLFLNP